MSNQTSDKIKVLHALLRAFIEMVAGTINVEFNLNTSSSRSIELSRKFRKLLIVTSIPASDHQIMPTYSAFQNLISMNV
jgi:hypothetical protein